jgi:dTMP kinase
VSASHANPEPASGAGPPAEGAPFIPTRPDAQPLPAAFWRVFGTRSFFRLWSAQVVSGLGDWLGVIAILALAARVSSSGAAIGLVMAARMIPGFVLAPIGGALVDRWNRKTVMVVADIGRAVFLFILPFWDTLLGLVVIALLTEVLTLLWGPAKDASVPNVVKSNEQLASANSLGLIAGFGTFPLGAISFAALAGVAKWLGGFDALNRFQVDQESLALWLDSGTFLVSAFLISRLDLGDGRERRITRVDWTQTFRDIADGLRFIGSHPLVRGVMIGLAGGLLGGGAMVPLGPVFAREVLGGGSAGFGLLMTALGMGAALGVVTLLWLQQRLPRATVFVAAVVSTGVAIMVAAATSTLTPALLVVLVVGATAGTAYVTGFTVLQESVADELRGRTFATLYTIVRLSLLVSLTAGPFIASGLDELSESLVDSHVTVLGASLGLPGVRLALWLGGIVTILAGVAAHLQMRRAQTAREVA